MKKEVIVHKNPKSPISEIFRTLRTNIQFMNTNKQMKSLLVTSTFSGEGKSWVTANLAVAFAQAGKKVILVDADMRKGREYAIFEVSPKPGLSNYLSQTETDQNLNNFIQETEIENLYVITAGSVPPNPSELLVSTQMIDLLEQLKQLCDIIIIDGTPCEQVTDSIILSRIADSTIIVTAYKKTKKDDLARVVRNIQNVGGNIAGVVLNKVPITSKKFGEQYYYGGLSTQKNKTGKKSYSKKMKKFDERVDDNIINLHSELKNNEKNEKINFENSKKEGSESEKSNNTINEKKQNENDIKNVSKNNFKNSNIENKSQNNYLNDNKGDKYINNNNKNKEQNNFVNNNKENRGQNNYANNNKENRGQNNYANNNKENREQNNYANNNGKSITYNDSNHTNNNTIKNKENKIQNTKNSEDNEKKQNENSDEFLNKTNEILKQINEYLDNEKKKME